VLGDEFSVGGGAGATGVSDCTRAASGVSSPGAGGRGGGGALAAAARSACASKARGERTTEEKENDPVHFTLDGCLVGAHVSHRHAVPLVNPAKLSEMVGGDIPQ